MILSVATTIFFVVFAIGAFCGAGPTRSHQTHLVSCFSASPLWSGLPGSRCRPVLINRAFSTL